MQVRALLYTSTLTNAIMEAMAAVETAVLEALAHQTTLYPRPSAPPPPRPATSSLLMHHSLCMKLWRCLASLAGSGYKVRSGLKSKTRREGLVSCLQWKNDMRTGRFYAHVMPVIGRNEQTMCRRCVVPHDVS